ncbi:Short-chain dehydrogenase/reductase SDR [Hoyosella subflava DQS3-9A1]|uniref:Short-chain dehydrogenase/reductase SDR n=1 Tax=Hoyosella subflava (strain DSM 45089 / JCM 17490 / NBRC 109087 / DQS3-9A1) TaxID=443218 RepID=F6EQH2_HOYSD|nr:Short-chain dehydrogenase/reductase SDR [Hoyosella subflava DQS3-9A1]
MLAPMPKANPSTAATIGLSVSTFRPWASWRGNFGQVNYVAAESGVVGFTRGFAVGIDESPSPRKAGSQSPAQQDGGAVGYSGRSGFPVFGRGGLHHRWVLDVDGGIGIGSSIR